MKSLIFSTVLCLLAGNAICQISPVKDRGFCPPPKPGIQGCLVKPETSCDTDKSCSNGQICCPDGCNRACQDPMKPIPLPEGSPEGGKTCPRINTGSLVGICTFDPSINCLKDDDCSGGKLCCPDGCGRTCKDSVESRPPPPDLPVYDHSIGQCPAVSLNPGPCVEDSNHTVCINNGDCTAGKICCGNGCYKACVDRDLSKSPPALPPQLPLPVQSIGQCPAVSVQNGPCVVDPSKVTCVNNGDCTNAQICCGDGCDKVCRDPDLSKKASALPPRTLRKIGQCPDLPTPSGSCDGDSNTTTCVGNGDCTNGQICCGNGCEKVCVDRDLSKRPPALPPRMLKQLGQCPDVPASSGPCVVNSNTTTCVGNGDCSNGQICCGNGCEKICMDKDLSKAPISLPLRPIHSIGQCPDAPVKFGACVFDPSVNCIGNDNCSSGQICCSDGCNKICQDPDLSKNPPALPPRTFQSIGQCPNLPIQTGPCVVDLNQTTCINNNDCSSGQICCGNGCEKICVDRDLSKPLPVLPPRPIKSIGQCPDAPVKFGVCVFDPSVNCVGNDNCSSGQICCSDGCNKICQDPDLSKSPPALPLPSRTFKSIGQCPNLPTQTGPCVVDTNQTTCINNNDCSKGQICCGNGCEKICVDRDLSKPLPVLPPRPIKSIGQCPQGPFKIGICIYDETTHCLGNSNCTNGQICCSDGCNKVCQDPDLSKRPPALPTPIPKGPGICPPIPLNAHMGGCVFNPDKNCRGDGECSDGQICCSDGCNKTCQKALGYLP